VNTRNNICLICLLLATLCPMPSSAEITLFVSPDGDGAFIIEGDNIKDTENVEITVNYDSTILANPRVSLQGGTVTNIYDGIPGTLTFNSYRGDNISSSFEAHLAFDKKGDSQGGIISVKAITMEPDGTSSPSRSILNLPSPPSSSAQATETNRELFAASASEEKCDSRHEGDSCKEKTDGAQKIGAGTDTASNDEGTASSPEKSATTEETATAGNRHDRLMNAEKSVLQRFKEFKGERGLKAFVALFEQSPSNMLVQEPPVILSDGKTPVRIRLGLLMKGGDSPNIALSDAKLVQLRKESEKGWVITVLPKEGTWNASLIIKIDEEIIEFPLVVAPPFKIKKCITERNFVAELDRFIFDQALISKGENVPPRQIPYEYVFTANYQASFGNHSSKMTSERANLVSNSKND
jgi:hypothetical protein